MARATSKPDLLAAIEKERGALQKFLDTLTPAQMLEPDLVGAWSAKDVLMHLVGWEQMCLGWYKAGVRGEIPALPAVGFKWNQTPALNQQIYEKYRELPLEQALEQFHTSHAEILVTIQALSDEQLFKSGQFAWTKKNAMGTYMVSATSSHYAWARKELRKGLKARQKLG